MKTNYRYAGIQILLVLLVAASFAGNRLLGADDRDCVDTELVHCSSAAISPAPQPAANSPAPAAANAAGGAGSHSFFETISISGLADAYYGYNFNRPESGLNQLRSFETDHNEIRFNLGKISVERLPAPLGFRADFVFGDTAKIVNSAEPGGSHLLRFMEQLYASYKAPVGRGLTIDFGKFVTPHGAEVIESKDNWNYSRSLLFSWAVPYYHFGARARYAFSDRVSAGLYVTNGWNDVVDNNKSKTYGFQIAINPAKKLSIVQNYMLGPEQRRDNHDWRHLWDTAVTYTASSTLSLMVNYDYGMDRVTGTRVHWQGVAGYGRIQIARWFAVSPRVEWYDDPQGFTTGTAQTVKEATFTAEFSVHKNLLLRTEYRQDWSDHPFFEKHDGSLAQTQPTATLGVIYFMSLRH